MYTARAVPIRLSRFSVPGSHHLYDVVLLLLQTTLSLSVATACPNVARVLRPMIMIHRMLVGYRCSSNSASSCAYLGRTAQREHLCGCSSSDVWPARQKESGDGAPPTELLHARSHQIPPFNLSPIA